MTFIPLLAALAGCGLLAFVIMGSLDLVLPDGRKDWAPAIALGGPGTLAAFFLFRFAGVL